MSPRTLRILAIIAAAASFVVGISLILSFFPFSRENTVNVEYFAGCYQSDEVSLFLDSSGKLITEGGEYWSYEIADSVPGKHGNLLLVENIRYVPVGDTIFFRHARDFGYRWPIDEDQITMHIYGRQINLYKIHFWTSDACLN